jgi:glutaredoxin 3
MISADRIVVYKTERCPYCVAAVRFLTEAKGLDIDIVDITGDWAARQALAERSGRTSVPQIWIGLTHVGGFDDLRALESAGELDPLLKKVASAQG